MGQSYRSKIERQWYCVSVFCKTGTGWKRFYYDYGTGCQSYEKRTAYETGRDRACQQYGRA